MQHTLFRLPTPRRFEPTREQLALMDLIALRDGLPLGELGLGKRMVLRNLLAASLVECAALGPAIYLLTPVGRVVRGRTR